MAKVQLRIPPSLVSMVSKQATDWVTFEPEIGEGTTIGDLLANMAAGNQEFRKAVFDPARRRVNEEILVVLNDSLLPFLEATQAKLSDGDSLMILPVFSGG